MPRIAIRHAHKLAYRRRLSLGLRMLGCLVMLAGAIVLAAALAELAKGPPSREARLMIALGPVLFFSGATFFCGERGLLIDRETRTLKRWWGVLLPLWRTLDDISHYQAIGVVSSPDAALRRWRVCLFDAQAERLELFELAAEDVADFAARQIAGFLSLPLIQPPFDCSNGDAAAAPVPAGAAPGEERPATRPWYHHRHFSLAARGFGMVCLVLGLTLAVGLGGATNLGGHRWLFLMAAGAPLCLAGLCLIAGGRRVVVDPLQQTVKIWRAWPLPSASYELPGFYAVIVSPESAEISEEPPPHLVGLIGAEQLRLEVVRDLPRDEALALAAELAVAAGLPLVEEPQSSLG